MNARLERYDPRVSEFESQEAETSYDRWFRAKVEASLRNTRPMIPHDEAMARLRAVVEAGKAVWSFSGIQP